MIVMPYLQFSKNILKLPEGVSISTMCGKCKLGTNLDLDMIKKYLELSTDDILTVKMSKIDMRTLIPIKTKKRRTKRKAKINNNPFYNQITVVIRVYEGEYIDLNDEYKINVKLFRNGSVQISGLTNIDFTNRALNKLITCLGHIKAIKNNNHEICIYSSGSTLAQKLIFKYSNLGDLSMYISKYFDTIYANKIIKYKHNCDDNVINIIKT